MKELLGRAKTVTVPFMETEAVEVRKLSTAQLRSFQAELQKIKEADATEAESVGVQNTLIRMAVVGADVLTDEEMDSFPLVDLGKLVHAILEVSGVATVEGNDSAKKS